MVGLLPLLAGGGPIATPVSLDQAEVLRPTHYAFVDDAGRLSSDWIPMPAAMGGIAGGSALCANIPAFDGAEINPFTAELIGAASCVPGASPAARRLLDVGADGNRANDCIPVWSQGFQTATGSEGVRAEAVVLAFYWRVNGSTCISDGGTPNNGSDDVVARSSEPCVIAIGTGEGYGDCMTGATSPTGGQPVYPGLVFRMPANVDRNGDGDTNDPFDGLASAEIDCRGGLRFYLAVINLCDVASIRMPIDGFGHYTIVMHTLDPSDPTGQTLTRATCAAPLAWGPDEPGENRPGAASEIAWLDLNNNGVAGPNPPECANLVGSCPQALSAAMTILHRVDTDRDSWPDALDNCPFVSNAGQADRDDDGVGDACDDCPDDPFKAAPGLCGCGVPEAAGDSDNDGVIDCLDECPGENDVLDRNHDGIPDCMQGCTAFPRGDLNGDGVVNNFDIDAFVEALVDREAYIAREGFQAWKCRTDVDGDGEVTNFDIEPFINCLILLQTDGCIPE
ncbi:MAG: hypothetical protein IPM64_07035 [Phycisphaerales bacterium]|nr:hypothetical protein [Phycisphaerales bacterium]